MLSIRKMREGPNKKPHIYFTTDTVSHCNKTNRHMHVMDAWLRRHLPGCWHFQSLLQGLPVAHIAALVGRGLYSTSAV